MAWLGASLPAVPESAAAQAAAEAASSTDRIDEAVLALLLLGLHDGHRAWKAFDWDAMERLHAKGLISNPASKSKSVEFSDEGLRLAQALHDRLFGDADGERAKAARGRSAAVGSRGK